MSDTEFVSVIDVSYGSAFYKTATDPYMGYRILKQAGVQGLLIRLGQGIWEDKRTGEHIAGAQAAGLDIMGVYFYQDDRYTNPPQQVFRAIQILKKFKLRPESFWWDIEHPSITPASARLAFDTLRRDMRAEYGDENAIVLGIYSRASFLQNWKNSTWINAYPFWVANYIYGMAGAKANEAFYKAKSYLNRFPTLPHMVNHWEIFQCTDRADGETFGMNVVSSPHEPEKTLAVDYNLVRRAFYESVMAGSGAPPPVIVPPGPGNDWENEPLPVGVITHKVVSPGLNVRADHSADPRVTIWEVLKPPITVPTYQYVKDDKYIWGRIGWKHWIALKARDGRIFAEEV